MQRTAEARFWQAAGAVIGVAGSLMVAYDFAVFGYASIAPRALLLGMAGSFLLLAGLASFVGGRTLHVEETALTPTEARLWMLLGVVCLIAGAVTVGFAWSQHGSLILDRMATGLAGSFSMMFGVICLVGERVMSHMHDALGAGRSEVKAAAKG